MKRPYVQLKAAISLDGCLDDAARARLVLSSAEDLVAADGLRAACDAVLIGAETLRNDAPRLLVRDEVHIQARIARGQAPQPDKIVITRSGQLPPDSPFFTAGHSRKRVYAPQPAVAALQAALGVPVDVRPLPVDDTWLAALLGDLQACGVGRLLVEGGAQVHRAFLRAGCFDALRLAIAPVVVGDDRAPRLFGPGMPPMPAGRLQRVSCETLGQTTVLHLRPAPAKSAPTPPA